MIVWLDKGFYAKSCFKTYHSTHGAKNTHSQPAGICLPMIIISVVYQPMH